MFAFGFVCNVQCDYYLGYWHLVLVTSNICQQHLISLVILTKLHITRESRLQSVVGIWHMHTTNCKLVAQCNLCIGSLNSFGITRWKQQLLDFPHLQYRLQHFFKNLLRSHYVVHLWLMGIWHTFFDCVKWQVVKVDSNFKNNKLHVFFSLILIQILGWMVHEEGNVSLFQWLMFQLNMKTP